MFNLFRRKFSPPSVTFATTVWEKDWRQVLLDPKYLREQQIANHCFPFAERLLIINNVSDPGAVQRAASAWIDKGILTRFVVAAEIAEELLAFFQLTRSDFRLGADAPLYENVN